MNKRISKYISLVFPLIILVVIIVFNPRLVLANDVCTNNPPGCIMQEIWYTHLVQSCEFNIYGIYTCGEPTQITEKATRCTIPQQGGGSCYCCYADGCYLNCPGNPGPGGDTTGDTTTDPVPTATPTPPTGTVNAVARVVTTDTTCAAVSNSSTGISGTQFSFSAGSASQPVAQTQSGNTAVSFTNLPVGSYNIDYTLPTATYTPVIPCVYQNGVLVAYGDSATLSGGTLEWRIGFTAGSPWVQTEGGNVYASATLKSFVPTGDVFNTDGDGGYPGVVTYGTDYDFDNDWASTGSTKASSENWLVNAAQTRVNYYDYFYRKYGAPTTVTTDPAFSNPIAVTQPPSSNTPYYVTGDITTTGDWSVGNNEKLIVIVNGNLTIDGQINIVGSGFVAFIVNGTITVTSNVGTTASSVSPVLEGVYVAMNASQTGGFVTGTSANALTARFVGKGMFIADNFTLQRDLEGYGVGNTGSSAELFIYNPRLILTMPEEMKENSVTWQEVAP